MDAQFFFVQYTASLGPGIMVGKTGGMAYILFEGKYFVRTGKTL